MKIQDFMLPCLSKKIFGIECPGCGLQRAIVLLFQGKFEDAFVMFPAIYTSILLIILLGIQLFFKPKNIHKITIPLAIVNAIIMVIAYIFKQFKLIY